MKYFCAECETSYSTISNLRKHARKFHPKDVAKLAPLKNAKSSPDSNFRCSICSKVFIHKQTLRRHAKIHDSSDLNIQNQTKTVKNFKKCALCEYRASYKKDLLQHYENTHEICMHWHNLMFSSMDDFNQWKMETEDNNSSKFVKKRIESRNSHKSIQYACHRSGTYFPGGKGLRQLKAQGSNKINAYCPANIQVFIENDEKVRVKYLETHVGHKLDIGHLQLTEIERKNIAAKIAAKIPFNVILNEIRDSITDNTLKRIHLTTKKDLFNIESSFNLRSSSVCHFSDPISVESWVIEMQRVGEHILFYKPKGDILEEHPQLRKKDFVLIIMTPAQVEMLKKYGSDCICLDRTQRLISYIFELHTLLIIDDLEEGFPCAFLFSNRADTEVISLFLKQIAKKVGILRPKTFMTDSTEIYFNAWLEVMGIPENRLFCTWHIDGAWRKNLSKIKNQEKKVIVYKQLRTLLQERDPIAFENMLEQYCNIVDDETLDFINYFKENYQKNYEYWAYCYRSHSDLNTNMHLEQMHKTIKHIYLAEKGVEMLDKGISALIRFVRDKLIDRLIVINKGKISSKLKNIQDCHNNREQIDPSLIVLTEHGWEISSDTLNEINLVQEGNDSCKCQLRCSECDICIHRYYCTCQDSSINLSLCKHIHLLAEFRKKNENISYDVFDEASPEVYELYIDSDENDESKVIITQLSETQKIKLSIEERHLNLSKHFHDILASANTHEKLDAIEDGLNSLSSTLAVIDHNNTNEGLIIRA